MITNNQCREKHWNGLSCMPYRRAFPHSHSEICAIRLKCLQRIKQIQAKIIFCASGRGVNLSKGCLCDVTSWLATARWTVWWVLFYCYRHGGFGIWTQTQAFSVVAHDINYGTHSFLTSTWRDQLSLNGEQWADRHFFLLVSGEQGNSNGKWGDRKASWRKPLKSAPYLQIRGTLSFGWKHEVYIYI